MSLENKMNRFENCEDSLRTLNLDIKSEINIKDEPFGYFDEYIYHENDLNYDSSRHPELISGISNPHEPLHSEPIKHEVSEGNTEVDVKDEVFETEIEEFQDESTKEDDHKMFKGHCLEGGVEEEDASPPPPAAAPVVSATATAEGNGIEMGRNPPSTPQPQVHKESEIHTKTFKCPSCSYSCTKLWKLKKHEKVHFSDVFHCSYCDFQTSMKRNLSRHELNHSDTKKYSCDSCDYKNNSKVLFDKHKLSHSEKYKNSKFKCPRCIFATDERDQWKNHVATHERITLHQCSSCEYATTKLSDIKRHRRTHMKNEPVYDRAISSDPNPQTYTERTIVPRHVLSNPDEIKLYQCDRCPYASKLKGTLNRHSMIHEAAKALKCPDCDYRTNFKNRLREHQKIHIQYKDFKCSYCDFETKHKATIAKHVLKYHKKC